MVDLKKLLITGSIVSSALILSACNSYKSSSVQNPDLGQGNSSVETNQAAAAVTFTDAGSNPAQVTVKSGEQITFINNSGKNIQVASDPHPVHTANKELSSNQFVLEIASGKSATVKVEKVGTFGYHDHLAPAVKGKVTVE